MDAIPRTTRPAVGDRRAGCISVPRQDLMEPRSATGPSDTGDTAGPNDNGETLIGDSCGPNLVRATGEFDSNPDPCVARFEPRTGNGSNMDPVIDDKLGYALGGSETLLVRESMPLDSRLPMELSAPELVTVGMTEPRSATLDCRWINEFGAGASGPVTVTAPDSNGDMYGKEPPSAPLDSGDESYSVMIVASSGSVDTFGTVLSSAALDRC